MSYREALSRLNASGPLAGLRRWINGPLRGVAEIYLPYRLYRITVEDRRIRKVHYYAVDAATGTLDPYEFSAPPAANERVEVETRNFHPARLDQSNTQKIAINRVRKLLYSRGFFRAANPAIMAELVPPEFYIPYWAGFYGDERDIRITVLNALLRTAEGNKVRHLVRTWLLERDSQRELNLAF